MDPPSSELGEVEARLGVYLPMKTNRYFPNLNQLIRARLNPMKTTQQFTKSRWSICVRLSEIGRGIGAVVLLAVSGSLWAQAVAPVTGNAESMSGKAVPGAAIPVARPVPDIVALSPFNVSADRITGYLATSTLAGTRLRSDLGDIGAAVSVVTSEFLRDTGATGSGNLLTFTTGTEVAGLAGNISGSLSFAGQYDETANLNRPQQTTRLRGLSAATEARDFFATEIPFDSYNIDRIDINRGANSVLFGTGSPSGIINSTLKRAQMKNSFEVEFRAGSYGATRTTIDINQQIIPGELALRLDGLYSATKYKQKYAHDNDKRLYGTVTYEPSWARTKNRILSGTVLRMSAERGTDNSEKPRSLPPVDMITGWFNPWFGSYAPKPTWDAANLRTNSVVNGVTLFTQAPYAQTTNMFFRNIPVLFNNPNSGTPNSGISINNVAIVGMQGVISNLPAGTYPAGTGLMMTSPDQNFTAGRVAGLFAAGSYVRGSLADSSIFDFYNSMLEGPNRSEYFKMRPIYIALEQRFFADRAGIQLELDRQSLTSGSCGIIPSQRQEEISIDANTTLLNGMPNPNFGRPEFTGAWTDTYNNSNSKMARATAYYRLDFADVVNKSLAKWLGTHTFTLLDEEGWGRALTLNGPRYYSPNFTYGNSNLLTDTGGNQVTQVMYVGPSLATATTAAGAHLTGLTTIQNPTATAGQSFLMHAQTAGSQFVVTQMPIVDSGLVPYGSAIGASLGGTKSHNQAAVIQSKFLQDTMVITYGLRRDHVDAFSAAIPATGPTGNLLVDPVNFPFPANPSSSTAATTKTKSVVLHSPGMLLRHIPFISNFSLRYNTSENLTPGSTRYDSNLAVLAPPTGKTKDWGFVLGLANDRVILNATWYETAQKGVTSGTNANLTQRIVDEWVVFVNQTALGYNSAANFAQLIAPPTYLLQAYNYRVQNGVASDTARSDIVLTQDYTAKGLELEAIGNITRNWRILLNATRQEAVTGNTGSAFNDVFFVQKYNGQTLASNWTGAAGLANVASAGGITVATSTQNIITSLYQNSVVQDGGPNQELRKWRWNAVTAYDFDRPTLLKGFSIGTGVRWQDKVAIGFPYIVGAGDKAIPDVKHPFYGPAEFKLDGWIGYHRPIFNERFGLTLQLNGYNLGTGNKLIPIATQPDGSLAAYRIADSRRFEFTMRLSY